MKDPKNPEFGNADTVYPQSVWDEEHTRDRFEIAAPTDQVRRWMGTALDRWFERPSGDSASCLEIGCFPGGYLAFFGSRGFEVNGVDLTPRVAPEMRDWLIGSGYRVGRIEKGDFFEFRADEGFDVVLSNGFLEHFPDWERCLHRHLDLVKPGGLLFLTAPNFVGGLQNFLHRAFDRENFDRHVLAAMDLSGWSRVVESRGFEVLGAEYFYEFDFWNGPQRRPFWQKVASRAIRAMIPILWIFIPAGTKWAAPYLGIAARRRDAAVGL